MLLWQSQIWLNETLCMLRYRGESRLFVTGVTSVYTCRYNMAEFQTTLFLVSAIILLSKAVCQPVWNSTKYQSLEREWQICSFPPNEIKTEEILGVCKRNNALFSYLHEVKAGINLTCILFETFLTKVCSKESKEDITSMSDIIVKLYSSHVMFNLCKENSGIKIPTSVGQKLPVEICKEVCAGSAAENLCRVISIFALTNYAIFEKAAADALPNSTATETSTAPTSSSTLSPSSSPASIENKTATLSTQIVSTTVNTSTGNNTKNSTITGNSSHDASTTSAGSKNSDEVYNLNVQSTGSITYGKLAIYGTTILLLVVLVYFVYKYRLTILSCLRESQDSSAPVTDGRGGYRKVPSFERVVPNMEERAKAKSFIY